MVLDTVSSIWEFSVGNGVQLGWFCPPGAMWQCLEKVLVVITGGGECHCYPLGQGQGAIHILQCVGPLPPKRRAIRPELLIMLRLRNTVALCIIHLFTLLLILLTF